MRSTRATEQAGRWWWSGIAALALHGALVLALPAEDTATRPVRAVPELTWLSIADTAGAAAAPRADESATVVPSARAARSPRAHARKHVAASTPAAQAPAREGELAVSAGGGESELLSADSAGGAAKTEGAATAPSANAAQGAGEAVPAPVRGPGLLLARTNPCDGFFPVSASADEGQVHIHVEVGADGRARASDLLVELPAGQGFGHAARACAAGLRFSPAVDQRGLPVAGRAKLALRFRRS